MVSFISQIAIKLKITQVIFEDIVKMFNIRNDRQI